VYALALLHEGVKHATGMIFPHSNIKGSVMSKGGLEESIAPVLEESARCLLFVVDIKKARKSSVTGLAVSDATAYASDGDEIFYEVAKFSDVKVVCRP